MALPTVWELLLPSFTIGTIIGALLIFIGIFKAGILQLVGKILESISGGAIKQNALRVSFIAGGVGMIWIPSIAKDLWSSTEGIILTIGIFIGLMLLIIILSKFNKQPEAF